MALGRKVAAWLLRVALLYSSPEGREWASAMLRELDFIESDWAALFWAVGSTTTMCGYALRGSWSLLQSGGCRMNRVAKRILGILSGTAVACLLAITAVGFLAITFRFFPTFAERTTWLPSLMLIVIPMIAFVGIGAALWKKRRPMAVGIFLSALALGTHFAIYVASHGNS